MFELSELRQLLDKESCDFLSIADIYSFHGQTDIRTEFSEQTATPATQEFFAKLRQLMKEHKLTLEKQIEAIK